MGQFSWRYSDTDKPMLDDVKHDSFLLVPDEFVEEFGGRYIKEDCYDGYGHIGGYDIFDLVAYWNREFLIESPLRESKHGRIHHKNKPLFKIPWWELLLSASRINNFKDFKSYMDNTDIELRYVGIDIACYDEDNASLKYPIKIVEKVVGTYESNQPSVSDPNQGWGDYDEEEDDEED